MPDGTVQRPFRLGKKNGRVLRSMFDPSKRKSERIAITIAQAAGGDLQLDLVDLSLHWSASNQQRVASRHVNLFVQLASFPILVLSTARRYMHLVLSVAHQHVHFMCYKRSRCVLVQGL